MKDWRRVGAIAEKQGGAVSRRQLRDRGFSDRQIDVSVALGLLVRVGPATFRIAGLSTTWHQRASEALVWAGPDAYLSHHSAGVLWELDGVPRSEVVEITTTRAGSRSGVHMHRTCHDRLGRAVVKKGLRVSDIDRTLLDLCACLPDWGAGNALDDALRRKLLTLDEARVRLEAEAARGRNGVAHFRELIEMRDPNDEKVRSKFESKMLRVLRPLGRDLVPDFKISVGGGRLFFADFAFPSRRLAVECHSVRWHHRQANWSRDLERDRLLKLAGWRVIYYSYQDVVMRPDAVRNEVATFLTASPTQIFKSSHHHGGGI